MNGMFPMWKRVITYAALIVLGTMFSVPFFWMITSSLKTYDNCNVWPPQIIPHPVTFEHYRYAVGSIPFGLYLVNTLVICAICVIGVVASSSLVAYGLSRIDWKGRNLVFMVLLSTMMLPYQVVMVPLFALFSKLGWVDTYLPLTVPAFFGNAFFIFLLRQFFMTVPQDLTEAAKLDGCTEIQVFGRIILPLAKPALATVGLFTFINTWNDYLGPLIYVFDDSRYTLSLGLSVFVSTYGSFMGRLMAASALLIIPIMVLFFFTQKTFIQGVTMTGMKG